MQDISGKSFISHLCIQTHDMEKTIEFLKSLWSPLGIKSWKTIDYAPTREELLYGPQFAIKCSMTMLTPTIDMDVIEPVTGPWFAKGFLRRKGEAIEHIAFAVPNFDEMIAKFEEVGFYEISAADDKGRRWVQLRNVWMPGGFGIELLEEGLHSPYLNMLGPEAIKGSSIATLSQIGGLVCNLDKDMKDLAPALELVGVGPWTTAEYAPSDQEMIKGKPFAMKSARAKLTPTLEIILSEPVKGENALFDYLENKGRGLCYLAFTVPEYDKTVATLEKLGNEVFASASYQGKRWCYFDTGNKPGGIILKLVEQGLQGV